jgi:sugar phosphate isomerase/epimerase
MKNITPRRISVSTWSLHRTLGAPQIYGVSEEIPTESHTPDALLKLPAQLADFGIHTVEICHFHLLTRDEAYLQQLRASLENACVELWSFLVDGGDVTHEQHGARDMQWIADWFPVAQALGAKRVRVAAGKTTSGDAISRSSAALRILAAEAKAHDLRLMTENWFDVLSTPQAVLALFENLGDDLGLCLDFGNWSGANKYADLKAIAHLAESCHTKAHFEDNQQIDRDDYARCLDITREAGFSGPYTLIYSSPGDEWCGLEIEMEVVRPYLS